MSFTRIFLYFIFMTLTGVSSAIILAVFLGRPIDQVTTEGLVIAAVWPLISGCLLCTLIITGKGEQK